MCLFLKEAGEISPAWSGLLFLSTSVQDKAEGPQRNVCFCEALWVVVFVWVCAQESRTNCSKR